MCSVFHWRRWSIAGIVILLAQILSQTAIGGPACPTTESILNSLRSLKEKALYDSLGFLQNRLAGCDLDDSSIDAFVAELRRIEKEDTYERVIPPQAKGPVVIERNSTKAKRLVSYLDCRKAVNAMRVLPISERVTKILDALEGKQAIDGGTSCLEGELIRIGEEALPVIVKRAPTTGQKVQWHVFVISRIGGEGSIKFLTRVFQERSNESWVRCDALQAVAGIAGPKAVPDLIEQLRDDTVDRGSRCGGQSVFDKCDGEPCQYKSFPLRRCAAAALTRITEKDWDPVFCEDYRTWKAWRDSPDPEKFHPYMLARSEQELKELATGFLNRALDGRFAPWNSPGGQSEEQTIGEKLRELEPYGTLAVNEYFQSRAPSLKREEAVDNLKQWTESVLFFINTPQARAARETVLMYQLPESAP